MADSELIARVAEVEARHRELELEQRTAEQPLRQRFVERGAPLTRQIQQLEGQLAQTQRRVNELEAERRTFIRARYLVMWSRMLAVGAWGLTLLATYHFVREGRPWWVPGALTLSATLVRPLLFRRRRT